MILELTLTEFDRLSEKLDEIGKDTANLRVEAALTRERITNVNEHLARINGRVGKAETGIKYLSETVTELRGAWKMLAGIGGAIGGGITWLVQHFNLGAK